MTVEMFPCIWVQSLASLRTDGNTVILCLYAAKLCTIVKEIWRKSYLFPNGNFQKKRKSKLFERELCFPKVETLCRSERYVP